MACLIQADIIQKVCIGRQLQQIIKKQTEKHQNRKIPVISSFDVP